MIFRLYAVAASAQMLQAILSAGALVLLARLLSPSQMGVYLLLFSGATIIAVAIGAGPHAAHLIMAARSPASRAELNGQGAAIAIGALLVVILVCSVTADRLASLAPGSIDARHIWVTAVLVPALVYGGGAHAVLTGSGRVAVAAQLNVVYAALAFGAPAGAAITSNTLLGSVTGQAVGTGIWAISAAAIMARHAGAQIPSDGRLWRQTLRLGVPLHVGSGAYWLMQRLDLFILNGIAGPAVVGVYGMARVLGEKTSVLIAPLHLAVSSRVSGDRHEHSRDLTFFVVRVLIVVAVALFGLGLVGSAPLLDAFAGSAYRAAALPLALLMATGILLGTWSLVALYLASQLERPWLTAVLQVIAAAVAAAQYVILGSVLGAPGMGLAALIASALLLGLGLAAVARHDLRPIAPSDLIVGQSDARLIRDALRQRSRGRRSPGTGRSRPPRQQERVDRSTHR